MDDQISLPDEIEYPIEEYVREVKRQHPNARYLDGPLDEKLLSKCMEKLCVPHTQYIVDFRGSLPMMGPVTFFTISIHKLYKMLYVMDGVVDTFVQKLINFDTQVKLLVGEIEEENDRKRILRDFRRRAQEKIISHTFILEVISVQEYQNKRYPEEADEDELFAFEDELFAFEDEENAIIAEAAAMYEEFEDSVSRGYTKKA